MSGRKCIKMFVNNSLKLTQIKKLGKMLPIIAQTLKVRKHRICVYKNVSCIKNSLSLTLIPGKKVFIIPHQPLKWINHTGMYRRKHRKCDEKRNINIIHLRPRFLNNVQVWRPLNCIVRSFALFLLFFLFDVVMPVKPLKEGKIH